MKYDMMVERNRIVNTQKEQLAVKMIRAMMRDDEQVTVRELVRRTGFSRNYFYTNPVVKEEVNQAKRSQSGKCYVRASQQVISKAFLKQTEDMRKEIERLRSENRQLKELCEVLKMQ